MINIKNSIIRVNSFVVAKAWSEYAVFIVCINVIFPFADKTKTFFYYEIRQIWLGRYTHTLIHVTLLKVLFPPQM